MDALLWAGFGISACGFFVQGALGLPRPIELKNILLSAIFFLLAIYCLLDMRFYSTASIEEGIRVGRQMGFLALGFVAAYACFIASWAQVRVQRPLKILFWTSLCFFTLYNMFSLNSLLYGTDLHLNPVVTFWGAPAVVLQSMPGLVLISWSFLQILLFLFGAFAGFRQVRRGEVRSGIGLLLGAGLLVIGLCVDLIHDLVGGDWPYLTELCLVLNALIFLVTLALEFRSKEVELAKTLLVLDDYATMLTKLNMAVADLNNSPIQVLTAVSELLRQQSIESESAAKLIERSAERLHELSNLMARHGPPPKVTGGEMVGFDARAEIYKLSRDVNASTGRRTRKSQKAG